MPAYGMPAITQRDRRRHPTFRQPGLVAGFVIAVCGTALSACGAIAPPQIESSTTPRSSAHAAPTASATRPIGPKPPDVGWRVNAGNVGLAGVGLSCGSLPRYTGPTKVPAGAVISQKRVTSALDLSAGGITIQRSCIQPTSVGRGTAVLGTLDYTDSGDFPARPVVIRDNDIDGSLLGHQSAALSTGFIGIADLSSNYVHHFGSGLALVDTGTSLDARVDRNYVTDLLGWGDPATTGNHSDAFTIRDFDATKRPARRAVVVDNRFDCDSPNATGAFFIQAWSGRIDNVRIQDNLLEGDGFQLALEANSHTYSNVEAVNNRFTGTGWGATYYTGGPGWTTWKDNYLYNPKTNDGRGDAI